MTAHEKLPAETTREDSMAVNLTERIVDQILARDAEAALRSFNQGYLYGLEQAKRACVFEQRNAQQFEGGGACIKAIERLIVLESRSSDTK